MKSCRNNLRRRVIWFLQGVFMLDFSQCAQPVAIWDQLCATVGVPGHCSSRAPLQGPDPWLTSVLLRETRLPLSC